MASAVASGGSKPTSSSISAQAGMSICVVGQLRRAPDS